MEKITQIKDQIGMYAQILFDRPNSIIVGRIIEIRDKAVKIDYAVEPISASSAGMMCTVFNYTCWIPKSLIINDKNGGLTVKKWFARNFTGGYRIKKYFIENEKQIFI